MKKYALLLVVLFVCLSGRTVAQNVAVGLHTGVSVLQNKNTAIGIPVGINAEWAYNSDHSFAAIAHYHIGVRAQDPGFFYISPEYKYHITGDSLEGFYVGAYMGFGGGNGSGYISLGAVTGYAVNFGERINLDASLQLGYGNFSNLRTHLLHVMPTLGVRYVF